MARGPLIHSRLWRKLGSCGEIRKKKRSRQEPSQGGSRSSLILKDCLSPLFHFSSHFILVLRCWVLLFVVLLFPFSFTSFCWSRRLYFDSFLRSFLCVYVCVGCLLRRRDLHRQVGLRWRFRDLV